MNAGADVAPILVGLVEDDAGTRERLATAMGAVQRLQLVVSAENAAQALQALGLHALDVMLVDLGLPDRPGLEVIEACRRMQPACEVMVISMFGDEAHMLRAFEHGARGYLLKDGTEDDLAQHVLHLHAGGSPMSPVIARQLLRRWQSGMPGSPGPATVAPPAAPAAPTPSVPPLSPRELEVLDLVARGFTYPEVARHCGLSVTTVRTHVRNIYAKLDVHTKTEAVYEARQVGLLR